MPTSRHTLNSHIRRAAVTVNGKPLGTRRDIAIVIPTGMSANRMRATLESADYCIESEWTDGTGTISLTVVES